MISNISGYANVDSAVVCSTIGRKEESRIHLEVGQLTLMLFLFMKSCLDDLFPELVKLPLRVLSSQISFQESDTKHSFKVQVMGTPVWFSQLSIQLFILAPHGLQVVRSSLVEVA